jgi:hypothetical protein
VREYINNNKMKVITRSVVAGIFAASVVIAVLFDDITPASMLLI